MKRCSKGLSRNEWGCGGSDSMAIEKSFNVKRAINEVGEWETFVPSLSD
jgi:hypothetical protein